MRRFQTAAWRLVAPFILAQVLLHPVWAEGQEGQADLDAATSLKFSASSMADLERVIELTESAIEKGLDENNEKLAKSLLTATLFQHGSRFAQALFDPRERGERPAMLRQFALKDFYAILEYDESLPKVYMMIARLEGVNVGQTVQDRAQGIRRGRDAADKAIELLEDDKPTQSKALVLRAGYEGNNSDARIELLNRAIDVDETNADAWRMRGKSRLLRGETFSAIGQLDQAKAVRQEAVQDFMHLLEENPNDPDALQTAAELLGRLGEFDKAMELADQVVQQNPRAFSVYLLRARLNHKQQKYDAAIADLNEAVDLKPDSFLAYLDRAEVHYDSGDKAAAAKDYGRARELQLVKPLEDISQLPSLVIQRTALRAEQNPQKVVAELKEYMEMDELNAASANRDPDAEYRLQLSETYTGLKQPLDAIEIVTPIIENEPKKERGRRAQFFAYRARGNSYLSVGKHKEAIEDYAQGREIEPREPQLLNNFAWVLSTSPQDDVRDAELAVELATVACEETKYKAAHILSTLAAAYAESGDWEMARKYSSQAVDTEEAEGDKRDAEMLKQLTAELASYEKEAPWRETQNVLEEKDDQEQEAEEGTSGDPGDSESGESDSVTSEPSDENDSDEDASGENASDEDESE